MRRLALSVSIMLVMACFLPCPGLWPLGCGLKEQGLRASPQSQPGSSSCSLWAQREALTGLHLTTSDTDLHVIRGRAAVPVLCPATTAATRLAASCSKFMQRDVAAAHVEAGTD